ncbi:MAG: TonB family protein [Candidatus Cloacimonadota bacterium]|nr:MAG: TonB family protein [Candidatus Cloacimonadota bacterium]
MHLSNILDCKVITSELSAYIDGELDKEMMKRVKEHLKTCEVCGDEYRKLISVKERIKEIEKVEVDSNIPLEIIDRISNIKQQPETAWFPVTIRVALLLAILLNIGIFSLFRDYRFKTPGIPSYKPIKIEHIILTEESETGVTVSFSSPLMDSIDEYTPPENVSMKKPSYSEKLLSQNIEGTVILNIVVDERGDVKNVRVTKSLSLEADSLSLVSARTMKFTPAMIDTVKVESELTATFLFKI